MSPKDSAGEIREQNLRKLQEHLEKLKKHGGQPPAESPTESPAESSNRPADDARSEIERAREQFARDFMQDFASWDRLYPEDETTSSATALRDPAADCRLLGVSGEASQEEIRRAFYSLAKKHHPDTGGDVAKFRELLAAYRFLSAEP